LNFSNISRISGPGCGGTIGENGPGECQSASQQFVPNLDQIPPSVNSQAAQVSDQQRIIQNINIDQSTNNIYNIYNYGGNNYQQVPGEQSSTAAPEIQPPHE